MNATTHTITIYKKVKEQIPWNTRKSRPKERIVQHHWNCKHIYIYIRKSQFQTKILLIF